MTIDEHITQLKKLKSFHNGSYGTSINFAIETMHKYQKIEEIYKNYKDRFEFVGMQQIGEVIDNGNDG